MYGFSRALEGLLFAGFCEGVKALEALGVEVPAVSRV